MDTSGAVKLGRVLEFKVIRVRVSVVNQGWRVRLYPIRPALNTTTAFRAGGVENSTQTATFVRNKCSKSACSIMAVVAIEW